MKINALNKFLQKEGYGVFSNQPEDAGNSYWFTQSFKNKEEAREEYEKLKNLLGGEENLDYHDINGDGEEFDFIIIDVRKVVLRSKVAYTRKLKSGKVVNVKQAVKTV